MDKTQNQSGKQLFEWKPVTEPLATSIDEFIVKWSEVEGNYSSFKYVNKIGSKTFMGVNGLLSRNAKEIFILSPAQPSTGKPTEEFEVKKFQETISCPECEHVQKATVELTIPWPTFIHYCEKCNYLIMESEWNKVENPSTGKQLPTDEEIEAKGIEEAGHIRDDYANGFMEGAKWMRERAQGESDKWISVENGLPEVFEGRYSDRVLCITTSGLIRVGYFLNGEWMMDSPSESFEKYGYTVTHWQALPNAPITNNQK